MLKMLTFILAIITAILIGVAASLQKAGLNKLGRVRFRGFNKKSIKGLAKQLLKARLWIFGLLISIIPGLLYMWLLSVEDVSVINPLISLSLVVILFNGYFFLKERLNIKQLIGAVGLIIGAVLMGLAA